MYIIFVLTLLYCYLLSCWVVGCGASRAYSMQAAAAQARPGRAECCQLPRGRTAEDACATEKLAEGIRGFAADTVKLEQFLRRKMDQMQP